MAFSFTMKTCFLAIFLIFHLPILLTGQYLPLILSPFFDNVCNDVECGKGTCQTALGQPFHFVCNCQQGWRRLRDQADETNFQFLPCIIPNCSVDYSCMSAPPPPAPAVPNNMSFFDPCYWMYCGEGTCMKNSTYSHICQCNPGQTNILDFPAYPCYSQCSLGNDCTSLGIKVLDKSTSSSTPAVSSNTPIDANPAISLFPGKLQWMGFFLIFGVILFWKQAI